MFPLVVRTLKTAIAAIASLFLAQLLGLENSATAAIVAILSVQDTRVSTSQGVIERIISAVLALFLGSVLIGLLGNRPIIFGVYLIIFVPLSFLIGVEVGLGPSSVLVTHLFATDEITGALLVNEIILTIIGTGFALLTNIYAPSNKDQLERLIVNIDEDIKELLIIFANTLTDELDINDYKNNLDLIDVKLESAHRMANTECDNNYCDASRSLLSDVRLRQKEMSLLRSIFEHIKKIPIDYTYAYKIGALFHETADHLTDQNIKAELAESLKRVEDHLQRKPLPQTYEEFLIRSNLQHIYVELIEFIDLSSKIDYKKQLDQEAIDNA